MVGEINSAVDELEREGVDTGSFMTVYKVRLESVKKIGNADFVVAVGKDAVGSDAVIVEKRFDPNDPNWMRQKELLPLLPELHGVKMTSYVFQSLVWRYKIRSNTRYYWEAQEGVLMKYSRELISFLTRLSKSEVESAINEYKEHIKSFTNPNKPNFRGGFMVVAMD